MEENQNTGNKMNPMMIGVILVAVLAIAGVVAWQMLGSTGGTEEAMTGSLQESSDSMSNGTAMVGDEESMMEEEGMMEDESMAMDDDSMMEDVTVIEVEGGSYYFEPDVIRVKRGETVKVVLSAVDMMHDFVVEDLGVRTEVVTAGNSAEVEFTPTEAGEYEFYCSVGNHRQLGMVGTLIVEE